jgi:hypothetical protein
VLEYAAVGRKAAAHRIDGHSQGAGNFFVSLALLQKLDDRTDVVQLGDRQHLFVRPLANGLTLGVVECWSVEKLRRS